MTSGGGRDAAWHARDPLSNGKRGNGRSKQKRPGVTGAFGGRARRRYSPSRKLRSFSLRDG